MRIVACQSHVTSEMKCGKAMVSSRDTRKIRKRKIALVAYRITGIKMGPLPTYIAPCAHLYNPALIQINKAS